MPSMLNFASSAADRPGRIHGWPLAGLCLLLGCTLNLPAHAQDAAGQPAADVLQVEPVIEEDALLASPEADPPARVARLGYLSGDADIAPAGSDDWAEAILNRPLTSGDRLWVQPGGRAELQAGGTVVYLNDATRFGLLILDDDVLQASLTQGAATVRVRRLAEGETLQVETPQATVVLREVGEYHLEVAADGSHTIVKTRSGLADVHGASEVQSVASGQLARFTGLEPLQASVGAIPPRTAFEDWANQRDARTTRSQSAQYVAEDVIGYEDLDEHGQWQYESEYGYVWQPRQVAVDWAPYRDGRWGWVAPWGWTWIDASRWGFAPFHYGRWVQVRQRWCWVPGPRHHRAVYSPALVGWAGSAPGISVSIGNIGWYPLGPRDVYRPGYRHSRQYIQRINISNTIFITQRDFRRGLPPLPRFDARRRHHGFTGVRYDLFVGARSLRGNRLRVDYNGLRRWRAHPHSPAIAPYRESVLVGRRRAGPGIELRQRDFIPARIPFHRERHAIQANGGRPLDRLQLRGASLNSNDLIAQRRQWQRELAQRNAIARNRGVTNAAPRSTGSRLIRDNRQGPGQGAALGFSPRPGTQRLNDRPGARATRDAGNERLQLIRARQNQLRQGERPGAQAPATNQRWRSPPDRELRRPEAGQRARPSAGNRAPEVTQRWRNPPARTQAPANQRFRSPPQREYRNNPSRNDASRRSERGSSSFVTQPRQQRNAQPSRPARAEPRARPSQRAERSHRATGNQRNRPQQP